MKIELLNPKAKKLLIDLVDLQLIRISNLTFSRKKFFNLLKELRQDESPSLEEIQDEVKIVRKKMSKGQ
ncbi:MAG: hypothetical protein JEY97_05365 [Bacteroidales bacterium]|nr:hypothetical protein [Bacteroidales bacterium]